MFKHVMQEDFNRMVRALDAFKANLEQAYEVKGVERKVSKEALELTDEVITEESLYRDLIHELIGRLSLEDLKDVFDLKKVDPRGKKFEVMNSTEVDLHLSSRVLYKASVKIRKGGARV
jgi:hypothetical protein